VVAQVIQEQEMEILEVLEVADHFIVVQVQVVLQIILAQASFYNKEIQVV
jgi:hypothetical protein